MSSLFLGEKTLCHLSKCWQFFWMCNRGAKRGVLSGHATFRPQVCLRLLFFCSSHSVCRETYSPKQSFDKLKILSRPPVQFCPRSPNLLTTAIQGMRVATREKAGDLELVFVFETGNFFRNHIGLLRGVDCSSETKKNSKSVGKVERIGVEIQQHGTDQPFRKSSVF